MNTKNNSNAARMSGLLVVLAFLTLGASRPVERPFKMKATGTVVISLIDASYSALEYGVATHTGAFVNEYSGYYDFDSNTFLSGAGVMTAANRDTLTFAVVGGTSSGVMTGGTGRFKGATGLFAWQTSDAVLTFDFEAMTLTVEYRYTGTGTLKY